MTAAIQVDPAALTDLLKTRAAEIDAIAARFAELIHTERSTSDMKRPGLVSSAPAGSEMD